MLKRLKVDAFKSLAGVEVHLPPLTVLVGPNAAGKSNFLDALLALSRIATLRTLGDALSEPIRGYPVEAFRFPAGGLPSLLDAPQAAFTLEADIMPAPSGASAKLGGGLRYRVTVAIAPASGALSVRDEYLVELTRDGRGRIPRVQTEDGRIAVRQVGRAGRARKEDVGLNYAVVSDPRWAGKSYRPFEQLRTELAAWRVYYLDPRVAMRRPCPPSDVTDIGSLGQDIAPFLYRLCAERPGHFEAVVRALRMIVPSVEDVRVDLDRSRGTLDIQVRQDGTSYSSRIISEGTLRVLALCAIAANPWKPSLVAFEEPENGVHPRRLELIADLLWSLTSEAGRQVVVTTHSPRFCDAILERSALDEERLGLILVRRRGAASELVPYSRQGPVFDRREIADALRDHGENGRFEPLVMRGLLDE